MVWNTEIQRLTSLILAIVAIAVLSVFTIGIGEPTGPDSLVVENSSRFTTIAPVTTDAIAGNVTELTITAQAATKAWQGYFGNVSGTITLEDSSSNVFYDWQALEPEGEVYASTTAAITWDNVVCFNFNADGGVDPNLTTEEARYGIDENDVDGIDETFNVTTHDQFYVGTVQITTDTCPATYVYQNSLYQTSNFQNILLVDPDTDALIFTTILENKDPANDTDLVGFDNTPTDFQLLVAEDEHNSTEEGPTTYYFWVEIE